MIKVHGKGLEFGQGLAPTLTGIYAAGLWRALNAW